MNPNHKLGGWADDTATIGMDAYVGEGAIIRAYAHVGERAIVREGARIGIRARIGAGAVIDEGAVIGPWVVVKAGACVGKKALILDDGDIAWGRRGGHDWTAWRHRDGTLRLTYGCESHPLTDWARLHTALARKHHKPGHGAVTRRVVRAVRALLDERRAPPAKAPRKAKVRR